jgi:predicted lipoprotein
MKRIWIICFLAAGILYACSKSGSKGGGGGGTTPTGGDEALTNIGNNIILLAYASLNGSVNSLDSAIIDFNAGPTADKLTALQNFFKKAYVNWEAVSSYNYFGPASSNQPVLSGLNLFPTNTVTIESNISSGSNNVNAFTNASAKGFPALDYLLFGAGNGTLAGFSDANRKAYLAAVSADIKAEVNAVVKSWSTYVTTFVAGSGNSVSGSLGLLINSMVQDFEITKNDRLGIPLGKQPPGQSLPILPKELEGYYSGISSQLCQAQLKSVQNLYLGIGTAGNGKGLEDYVTRKAIKYGNGLLNDTLKVQFTSAVNGMAAIADPMSASIQSNAAPANAVYATTQLLVVLLKTDMASGLGILITFGDNDGD